MTKLQDQLNRWMTGTDELPALRGKDWYLSNLLGAVFVVMAILQIISFNGFKEALRGIGLTSSPAVWAVLLIIVELWAMLGFFKIRLNPLARRLSGLFAVLVSGFWFIQTMKLVSEGAAGQLPGSGFFGKYLQQSPGWWTVVEASLLLFTVVYVLSLSDSKNK